MYHTMIAPNLYHDINGEYRGTNKVVYKDNSFTNYTLFSLWDTYRAAHPLYTITHPERASDFINSMVKICRHQGKLPVWHLEEMKQIQCPVIVEYLLLWMLLLKA